jgi:TPR repeat protein
VCSSDLDQGHADAQNNLGTCYYNGQGVPQDYAQAAGWYRKAADQGFALAQRKLEEERKNKRERQIILSIVGMVVGIGLSLAAVGIGMTGIGILIFFIATIVGIGGIIGAKYESTHTKNGCQTPF